MIEEATILRRKMAILTRRSYYRDEDLYRTEHIALEKHTSSIEHHAPGMTILELSLIGETGAKILHLLP